VNVHLSHKFCADPTTHHGAPNVNLAASRLPFRTLGLTFRSRCSYFHGVSFYPFLVGVVPAEIAGARDPGVFRGADSGEHLNVRGRGGRASRSFRWPYSRAEGGGILPR